MGASEWWSKRPGKGKNGGTVGANDAERSVISETNEGHHQLKTQDFGGDNKKDRSPGGRLGSGRTPGEAFLRVSSKKRGRSMPGREFSHEKRAKGRNRFANWWVPGRGEVCISSEKGVSGNPYSRCRRETTGKKEEESTGHDRKKEKAPRSVWEGGERISNGRKGEGKEKGEESNFVVKPNGRERVTCTKN